jgi:hypothetical protein
VNTGVEILLKRIKDCPDDFQYDINTDRSTKWNKLLMEALRSDVITEEEKVALRAEVTEMGRARFTEKVMQTLAGVEDETSAELEDNFLYSPTSTVTLEKTTQGTWATGATGTSAFLDAQRYQTEMMRQQVDAMGKVQVRKKATIR